MKKEILEQIGFSKNEAKVYLALIELGNSTAGEISKKSKVHRTNVYDALEGLGKKGAVAHFSMKDIRYYEAVDPEMLMNLLREKEIALQSVMHQLKLTHQSMQLKTDAQVYEGLKSVKEILNGFLDKKKPILVYGIPKDALQKMQSFIIHYHKKRIAAKIEMKHVYNDDAIDRIKYLNSLPYTEARNLPKEFNSPVSTNICGDEVVLIIWQDPVFTIQIKSKEMADSYRKYFKILWEIAKKK